MGSEWHYTQNGQPAPTPVGTAQLKQLATSGLLKPDDLVWQEGMTNWLPASSIKGLFSNIKASTGEMPALAARSGARTPKAEAKTDAKEAPKPEVKEGPDDGGIHPLLVFLLFLVTGGLFGLVYAFQIAGQYSARFGKRKADSAGRPLGVVRHPVAVLALTWITLGYYLSYWIAQVLREGAAYTGQPDVQSRRELSLMLVIPFYSVYLAIYRVPEMVRRVQAQAGVSEEPGPPPTGMLLNPCLFLALPVLCMRQQEALNQVWISAP
jgi:GYF domain 2